jgi:2',3'-cyclic-nucleotide 2'-phosphodiesterase (5'-nucleotidase family)
VKQSLPLFLALALASCAPKPLLVADHKERLYVVDSTSRPDSLLVRMMLPYKHGVDTLMQAVVGHTDVPLTKAQPECLLGNFMADASLQAARKLNPKTDAAVMNYGGIRVPMIMPGAITRGKLFELMPFDNLLCIVDVPGTVLQQFCDQIAAARGWPVSGIRFVIRDRKATDVRVNGEALDPNRVYHIAVNDYLANGGDNCSFLRALPRLSSRRLLRDILTEHVAALEASGKPLHPVIEDRITYAE